MHRAQREPAWNWGYVCDDHAPRPNPVFVAQTPTVFLGRCVKMAFRMSPPKTGLEHMWVEIQRVGPDGRLHGRLDNDPVHVHDLRSGDPVSVPLAAIEDVYPPLDARA